MQGKECVVGYKTQINERGFVHGHCFDKLESCCEEFKLWLLVSEEERGSLYGGHIYANAVNGVNFTGRGARMMVVLHLRTGENNFMENEMKFCPFCGAAIEVKETRKVLLRPRTKTVEDGYDEVERRSV